MENNPYFDPNPRWMFVTLQVWLGISIFIAGFGFYLIVFKSPPYKSRSFRILLLYHVFTGIIFELHLTILSPPLVYLPYVAVGCPGIWTALGIPMDIQVSVLITLIILTVAAICPLFYYRMDMIIPINHPLNQKWIRYGIYFIVYFIFHLLPIPMLLQAINYYPQEETKHHFEEVFNIELEGFWRKEVLTANLSNNPWALTFIGMLIFAIFLAATVSVGCTYVIYHTIKTQGNKMMSRQMKKENVNMLFSLILLMVIITSVAVFIGPFIIYVLCTNSPRCDILNGVIAVAAGMYPAFVTAYVINYRPYRQAILKMFRKTKIQPKDSQTTIFVMDRSFR